MNNAFRPVWLVVAVLMLIPVAVRAQDIAIEVERDEWTVELSIYMLGAGMTGETGVGGNVADVDLSFGDVLENLELGGMGSVRIERDRWAFTTDVIYMGLGASKGPFSADVDQWMVEPSVSFRVSDRLETIVGVRYVNLATEIRRSVRPQPFRHRRLVGPVHRRQADAADPRGPELQPARGRGRLRRGIGVRLAGVPVHQLAVQRSVVNAGWIPLARCGLRRGQRPGRVHLRHADGGTAAGCDVPLLNARLASPR